MPLPQLLILHMLSIATKAFSVAMLSVLLVADAVFLGYDNEHLIAALIGSVSGSFILTYYRQGISWSDKIIKTLASALGGLFAGAVINTYFNINVIQYFTFIFFFASFLVLIFLRSVLTVAEKNATGIVTVIAQKIFRAGGVVEEKRTEIVTTKATKGEVAKAHEAHVLSETETAEKTGE